MLKRLKKAPGNRRVQLLIWLVFSATIINIVFFFHLMKQNTESIEHISRNEHAALLTRRILGTIKDAELGQRGYMLTGREKYLEPYNHAIDIMPALIDSLRPLLNHSFSKADQLNMDTLNIILLSKQNELSRTIQLKKQQHPGLMLNLVNSDLGENDMRIIRNLTSRLLNSFYAGMAHENQKIAATLRKREISVVLFSILVISAVIIMRVKILNRDRRNADMFEAMEVQNIKLISQQQELKDLSIDFSSRNTELEHFTHIISHDLRGPLSNIISLIDILEDDGYTGHNNPAFKMLKNSSTGLFHKLDDLIILLRDKKGGMLLKEPVILSQLLAEVKANYKLEIERSGTVIEADFEHADEALFVKIYMQSILQNLISNAIKYRDHDRKNRITLRTFKEGGMLRIMIRDNGQGIDMDKYGRDIFGLFKTFHTADDSHGVGLYLVKKQVNEMDGEITIQSEVGQGTTFNIIIPA
jgi:signal transduction histidine kinase